MRRMMRNAISYSCMAFIATAGPGFSQNAGASGTPAAPSTVAEPVAGTGVAVTLSVGLIRQKIDEMGVPVTDDIGAPVMVEVPADGLAVLPGEEIVYRIGLQNGAEEVGNIALNLPMPEGMSLKVDSLESNILAEFSASARKSDVFVPVFAQLQEGERNLSDEYLKATADGLDGLRAWVAILPPSAAGQISYRMILR
ncbi:hypothetical protein ACEUZ9_001115 [Paracoccus litorisediminis]|uniref:hypothetical protein n=1 Tax=Paracoccus litorisediminis TaxID=2006130 RepID=UPI003731BEC1